MVAYDRKPRIACATVPASLVIEATTLGRMAEVFQPLLNLLHANLAFPQTPLACEKMLGLSRYLYSTNWVQYKRACSLAEKFFHAGGNVFPHDETAQTHAQQGVAVTCDAPENDSVNACAQGFIKPFEKPFKKPESDERKKIDTEACYAAVKRGAAAGGLLLKWTKVLRYGLAWKARRLTLGGWAQRLGQSVDVLCERIGYEFAQLKAGDTSRDLLEHWREIERRVDALFRPALTPATAHRPAPRQTERTDAQKRGEVSNGTHASFRRSHYLDAAPATGSREAFKAGTGNLLAGLKARFAA